MRRMAVYLGLVEDDSYDDYEEYENYDGYQGRDDFRDSGATRGRSGDRDSYDQETSRRGRDRRGDRGSRRGFRDQYDVDDREDDRYSVRTLTSSEPRSVRTIRPGGVSDRSSLGGAGGYGSRGGGFGDMSRIETINPHSYNDARRIGEEFRAGVPVIMNLGDMGEMDAKRVIDFAAGLVFGLHGKIERISGKVFLLSPANVDLGEQARAQIAQDGFYNQS